MFVGQEWGYSWAGLSASGSHKAAIKVSTDLSLGKNPCSGVYLQESVPHGMLDRGPHSLTRCWPEAALSFLSHGPSQHGPYFLNANKREPARKMGNIITSHHLALVYWLEASHKLWLHSGGGDYTRHEQQKVGTMRVPLESVCYIFYFMIIKYNFSRNNFAT